MCGHGRRIHRGRSLALAAPAIVETLDFDMIYILGISRLTIDEGDPGEGIAARQLR
jgi:hypothetical protein